MPEIRFVLVGTQHPGNIGAAARAIKTMGLSALHLVAPRRYPDPEAIARAAGADDILDRAPIHSSLPEALTGCRLVLGCTARQRNVALAELTPRQAAARLIAEAGHGPVAVLFGRERTGLENDELQCCDAAVHIPTAPDFGSLNLAAAVQVLAYEVHLAGLEFVAGPVTATAAFEPTSTPAPRERMERFFEHLARTLDAIEFHKGRPPGRAMQRLRRLFLRARPDDRELRLLHGILAESERMAMLAAARQDPPDHPG